MTEHLWSPIFQGVAGVDDVLPMVWEDFLTAAFAPNPANTRFELPGLSLTLPAGTFEVDVTLYCENGSGGAEILAVTLNDGTADIATSGSSMIAGGNRGQAKMSKRITLAAPATIKVFVESSTNGGINIKPTVDALASSVVNTATRIRAVQCLVGT